MKEINYEEIINNRLFWCDEGLKQSATTVFQKIGEQHNYAFKLDEQNNKDLYARVDVKFAYLSNKDNEMKEHKYAVEIKGRDCLKEDYPDVMFEWEKIYELRRLSKEENYRPYFMNIWKDGHFVIYNLNLIDDTQIRTGNSYQKAHTKGTQYYGENKQQITKAYLPTTHPSIVVEGNMKDYFN